MMEEQHVITEFGFKRTQSGSACLWFWQGLVQLTHISGLIDSAINPYNILI